MDKSTEHEIRNLHEKYNEQQEQYEEGRGGNVFITFTHIPTGREWTTETIPANRAKRLIAVLDNQDDVSLCFDDENGTFIRLPSKVASECVIEVSYVEEENLIWEGFHYDALSDIVLFNIVAGNTPEKRSPDHELCKLYLDLMEEELVETNEAMDAGDREAILDGAGDTIVVAAGLINALGADPNKVLSIINQSNMSKFCETEEDAKASVASYEGSGRYEDVHYRFVSGYYVILGRKVGAPEGSYKILKGIHFQEPDLSML